MLYIYIYIYIMYLCMYVYIYIHIYIYIHMFFSQNGWSPFGVAFKTIQTWWTSLSLVDRPNRDQYEVSFMVIFSNIFGNVGQSLATGYDWAVKKTGRTRSPACFCLAKDKDATTPMVFAWYLPNRRSWPLQQGGFRAKPPVLSAGQCRGASKAAQGAKFG